MNIPDAKGDRLPPTLVDVARLSNVSRSTASRVLSGSPRVSSVTRAAVLQAAEELGYRPNRSARALRTDRSRLIGLVLTNLVNASFQTMTEVLQRRLADEDYQMLLCLTGGSTEMEATYVSMLIEHQVDGLIMMGSSGVVSAPEALRNSTIPVVNLIRRELPVTADSVLAADEEGAHQATAHLTQLGHRRIGLIVGTPDHPAGNDRRAGYLRALGEADIPIDPELIADGPYSPEFGARMIRRLLDLADPPTALFLANHEASLGALPILAERGILIPSKLSVVCFEDAPFFRYSRPPLTFVDHDPHGLADLAVNVLLNRLRGSTEAAPRQYRLGAKLVERDSCGPPPKDRGATVGSS